MDKYEKLELIRKRVNQNSINIHTSTDNMERIAQKYNDASNIAQNADTIITDIENQFNSLTGIINKKDQIFLWTAVALQCIRWMFQPKLKPMEKIIPNKENRIEASENAKLEKKENSKWYNKNSNKESKEGNYLNWEEYFINPVPYDAMKGTEDIIINGVSKDKNLCGKNHHSSTLGHDPILGYVFGTFNIMTSTITFNRIDLLSRIVDYPEVTKQSIDIGEIVKQVIESEKEDKLRIPAAVARQCLHIQSDKYTKMGLPIPLLSAKKQQELLKKGWNSKEFDRLINELKKSMSGNLKVVGVQITISCIISIIIYALHRFMYDEDIDGDIELYSVRTSKIITYSNLIAEGINLAVVAAGTASGIIVENPEIIKNSLSKMDIGGYISAISSIVYNGVIQNKIKEEFLRTHWYDHVTNELRSEDL